MYARRDRRSDRQDNPEIKWDRETGTQRGRSDMFISVVGKNVHETKNSSLVRKDIVCARDELPSTQNCPWHQGWAHKYLSGMGFVRERPGYTNPPQDIGSP